MGLSLFAQAPRTRQVGHQPAAVQGQHEGTVPLIHRTDDKTTLPGPRATDDLEPAAEKLGGRDGARIGNGDGGVGDLEGVSRDVAAGQMQLIPAPRGWNSAHQPGAVEDERDVARRGVDLGGDNNTLLSAANTAGDRDGPADQLEGDIIGQIRARDRNGQGGTGRDGNRIALHAA